MDVLVVDDDLDLRETIAMLLEDSGFQTATARDGRDALELLAQASRLPKLILLDLSMPVMNGIEFRHAQLADTKLAPIPVVVLSASGRIDQEREKMNIREALPKPFEEELLLTLVRRYCDWGT